MKLLDKRPLCIVILAMLCGLVFYAQFSDTLPCFAIIISLSGLLSVLFLIWRFLFKKRGVLLLVTAAALLFTLLFSYLYFDLWFKAYERFDGEVHAEGIVLSVDKSNTGTCTVAVRCDNINEEPCSSYKLMMRLDEEDAEFLAAGAVISFDCELRAFESFGADFDSAGYYSSLAFSAMCHNVENIAVYEYTEVPFEVKLLRWRDMLSRRAIMLSDSEGGSFLAGLLLGEQKYLDAGIASDFKRSGVSHILALSGMHFVILGFGLERLLKLLNVNKKLQKLVIILFAIAYTGITGCSATVLRAGIMLVVSSLLYLLCGSRDSLTNLFISCALICFITPYSVYSVSLWLSAFSTLGIIAMGEFREEHPKKHLAVKFLYWIWDSFVASFFAVGAIFFILSSIFSEISLMMLPANLLLGPLSDLYLYIGSLVLIIGDIIPLGKLLSPLFKLISYIVGALADIKLAAASVSFTSVEILILIFTVLYFAFILFDVKYKKSAFAFLCALFVTVFTLSGVLTYGVYNEDDVLYDGDKTSDTLLIKSCGELVLIDSGSYSESSAYGAVDFLKDESILYLDKYVLTGYTRRIDDMAAAMLKNIKVEEIYLPYPKDADERSIADKLTSGILDIHGVTARFYIEGSDVELGEFIFCQRYRSSIAEGKPISAYTLRGQADDGLAYLSVGLLEKEKPMATELMEKSSTVIFGCHGTNALNPYCLDYKCAGINQIIYCPDMLIFDRECYIFYKQADCVISRGCEGCELDIE